MSHNKTICKTINFELLLLFALLVNSCRSDATNDYIIDSNKIGDIKLCGKISDLKKNYKNLKDTVFEGDEGVTWKGYVVKLNANEIVIVETSWIDSTSIFAITTNSEKYKTLNGYHVGDKISNIIANNEKIEFFEGEFHSFQLISKEIKFWFTIEEEYSNEFYQKLKESNGRMTFPELCNKDATIITIGISGKCK